MSDGSSIFKNISQWLREATKPAALWDGLKTAVWVVPLTVMIWVYAEQQQPEPLQSQPVEIDLHSSDPNRLVTIVGDGVPVVDMQGPKSRLDAVTATLSESGFHPQVHIEVPSDLPIGTHYLNITSDLVQAPFFKSNEISVSNVRPAIIQVKVDELQKQEVPVTTAPNPDLVDAPIFDHQAVTIIAPKSAFDQAGKNASLAFVQIPTTGESPGTHSNFLLKVQTPLSGDNVTILPPTVTATFTMKQSDQRFMIDSLPIRRSFSYGVPNDVTVDVDGGGTIPNVWVSGPPDEIARIKSKKTIPYASLLIDSDDVTHGSGSKTLVYNMIEPNVKVEDVNLRVSFTVHRLGQ